MSKNYNLSLNDTIQHNAKSFMMFIIRNHFPSVFDGLKSVHRRIIYALRDTDKPIRSERSLSKISKYHIHNNLSTYDVLMKLSQEWKFPITLTKCIGDSGCYSAPHAWAAFRYTDSCLSQAAIDIFINDTNLTTLPHQRTEDLSDQEPKYFIPKIPTALLFPFENIGYGFTSRPMCYSLDQVCQFVKAFLDPSDTNLSLFNYRLNTEPPWFYGCSITNMPQYSNVIRKMSTEEFGTGKLKIRTEGRIYILPKNVIAIKTTSNKKFIDIVEEELKTNLHIKQSWFNKNCVTVKNLADKNTPNEGDLQIQLKQNVNPFLAIHHLKKYIQGSYSVYNNFELNGYMLSAGPTALMRYWVNARKRSIIEHYKQQAIKLKNEIFRIEALLKIEKDCDKIITIIRNNVIKDAIEQIFREFDVTRKQAQIIANTSIGTLSIDSLTKLRTKLTIIKMKLQETIQNYAKNPENIIREQVEDIESKYGHISKKIWPKSERLRTYIGLLVTNLGCILIESKEDLNYHIQLLKTNKFELVTYIPFTYYHSNISDITDIKYFGKKLSSSMIIGNKFSKLGKYIEREYLEMKYSLSPSLILESTVRRTCCIIKDRITFYPEIRCCDQFVSYGVDNWRIIRKNGSLFDTNLQEFSDGSKRKTWNKTVKGALFDTRANYLAAIPERTQDPCILVLYSLKYGEIHLHQLNPKQKKLILPPYEDLKCASVLFKGDLCNSVIINKRLYQFNLENYKHVFNKNESAIMKLRGKQ